MIQTKCESNNAEFKTKSIYEETRELGKWKSEAPFTRVRTNLCTDKNLHGSTLRLHGTGGTGRIFERLRPRLHGSGQIFARAKTCTVPPCVYTEPAVLDEFLNG